LGVARPRSPAVAPVGEVVLEEHLSRERATRARPARPPRCSWWCGEESSFYSRLLGIEPAIDFTGETLDSELRSDPHRFFGGCTYSFGGQLLGLRPVAGPSDRFDSTRVGLDHLSLAIPTIEDLGDAARRMEKIGISHGDVTKLPALGIAILSFQDPDDINLELVTLLDR
jgi:glyoxylase I family protein